MYQFINSGPSVTLLLVTSTYKKPRKVEPVENHVEKQTERGGLEKRLEGDSIRTVTDGFGQEGPEGAGSSRSTSWF